MRNADGGEPQGFGELPHKPRPELNRRKPPMSESPDLHRTKALELAIQGGGTHTEVVTRANAYHQFLNGSPAGAAVAQTTAATPKPATGKPAAAPKATPAPGTKPAAA